MAVAWYDKGLEDPDWRGCDMLETLLLCAIACASIASPRCDVTSDLAALRAEIASAREDLDSGLWQLAQADAFAQSIEDALSEPPHPPPGLPTSTADYTLTFSSFTNAPQHIGGVLTSLGSSARSKTALTTDTSTTGWALYSADATNEASHAFTHQDGASTMQSVSYFDSAGASKPAYNAGDSDTSAELEMALSAFSDTGPLAMLEWEE